MTIRRVIRSASLTIPLVAWLAANLWLESPPGRRQIAARIHRLTGLDTHIGGASLTPWNGVSLYQVSLLQPPPLRPAVKEPLVRIASVRLTPVWRSWLRGKPEMRVWQLDAPQWVVPVEILADIARSLPPVTPTTPALAANTPPPATGPTTQPATPAVPAAPSPPPPPTPAVALPPTVWLQVKDASFTLLSAASGKKWCEVSGLDAAIPYRGQAARAALRIRSILVAECPYLTSIAATLEWQSPVLSLQPLTTDCHGIQLVVAAKIAMLNGIPLQLEAMAPTQKIAAFPLPADGHAHAESFTASARFHGLLLAPASWQGELAAEAIAPSARVAGHDATFDRGSAFTVLQGGTLSCLDARLIGDNLSFLGNATLLADGRLAAALRMVAPPETATTISQHAFPNSQPPPLTPLSTPQRAALDLEASGTIDRLSLRLGRDGPVISDQ